MSDCFFYKEGRCALMLFDGSPGEEDCASCMKYSGKPRGLGDTVHKTLSSVGIPQVVTKLQRQKDCGCGKRRAALNKLFPSKDKTDGS